MLIIGLTGPSGAGKTTVSRKLAKRGFFIADGDCYARVSTSPGSPVLLKLAAAFGDDIILPSGALDRRLLGSRAFSSRSGTKTLNSITHPVITELMFSDIKKAAADGFDTAVIDAAALIESGVSERCDIVAVVSAPRELRLERVIARDGLTPADALRRINAQKSEEYYERFADIIIRNHPPHSLEDELLRLYDAVERKRHESSKKREA